MRVGTARVIAFELAAARGVPRSDLYPPAPPAGAARLYYRAFDGGAGCAAGADARASGCVAVADDDRGDEAAGDDATDEDGADGDAERRRRRRAASSLVFVAPASDLSNVTGGTDFAPVVTAVWRADACAASSGWVLLGWLLRNDSYALVVKRPSPHTTRHL